ncbi:MAG: GNAT family N-acetyltransferase [Eubacteriales bacterium]
MNHHILASDRILVRPVLQSDIEAIHEYAGDKSISMMLYLPNDTIEETAAFVNDAVSEWEKDIPNDREYVIVYQDKVIGGICLEHDEAKDACEIGWIIHKDYRKQGIATEAAELLIAYAFQELSVHKVIAHCDAANRASEKVMIKLGMTLIDKNGTRVYPKTGVITGEYLYEITKDEYFRQKKR